MSKFNTVIKCCAVVFGLYLLIYVVSNKQTSHIIVQLALAALENEIEVSVTELEDVQSQQRTKTPDDPLLKVREITNCFDRSMVAMTQQRSDYWVLYNYVKASREFKCHESVTYTTHADYTFIDNLLPLVERWKGPISVALYAPGTDFSRTIEAIAYLRDCTSSLVKDYITFHIYFNIRHVPKVVPMHDELFTKPYNCSQPALFLNVSADQMYKTQNKLLYPVNVGRNIAREMAQTHFIFASEIELYPTPNTITHFLEMIAENNPPLQNPRPRVFPLNIFEINADQEVPNNKTMLKDMLFKGKALTFHKIPKNTEWIEANETEGFNVFYVAKRIEKFVHWEPFFIGTHAEPLYDERLSWEGKSDRMTQGYALCVRDYDFMILDNAFLVHKPGIKVYKSNPKRAAIVTKTNHLIKEIVFPELTIIYGAKKGCAI